MGEDMSALQNRIRDDCKREKYVRGRGLRCAETEFRELLLMQQQIGLVPKDVISKLANSYPLGGEKGYTV